MFVTQILVANVVLPCVISLVTITVLRMCWKRNACQADSSGADSSSYPAHPSKATPSQLSAWLAALAPVLAIEVAFAYRNGIAFWSEDSWLRIPLAVAVTGLAGAVSEPLSGAAKWASRLAAALVAAWMVFPLGEVWEFLLPERSYWIAAMALGTWGAWWALDRYPARDAACLAFSWIGCVAAAAFLTSQSFMKVTEPLLAVASVLGCFSMAAYVTRVRESLSLIAGPCLMGLSAIVSNAQFNSYLGLSNGLSWFAMSSPAVVALICLSFVGKLGQQPRTFRLRLAIFGVAMVLTVALVAWTQWAAGSSHEG